jgi:uncharacterized protein
MSRQPRSSRNGAPPGIRLVYWLFAGLILLLLIGQLADLYVEDLWYLSVGYQSVFWYRLSIQGLAFLVFGLATAAVLALVFRYIVPTHGESRSVIELGGEALVLPDVAVFRRTWLVAASLLGLFFGMGASAAWTDYALWLNRPGPTGIADPVLGRDLSFYFFDLPVLDRLVFWLLSVGVIVLIAGGVMALIDRTLKFRGLSLGLLLVTLALAGQAWMFRFHLMLQEHDLFSGVGYAGEHAVLPGLWAVVAALLTASALALYNLFAPSLRNLAAIIALPAATWAVAGLVIPGYITKFIVKPNELSRETPYIARNIESTRRAFGLDTVEQIPFDPAVREPPFDPEADAQTLENMRLWDWGALQSTLEQVQEIRTYYDFIDVDVDRYVIDGEERSMMLATREMNLARLPSSANDWINQRLIFTHGYGVTMNPVNRFTADGRPDFVLSDMPVSSTVPSLQVTRPEIYFGETTNWPVYVNTLQQEFNYPEGESNNYSTYEADAGIPVGGFFRKLVLAWQTGELMTLPFANDVVPTSQLLMRRGIRDRVERLAPFLIYDDDAYIVVGDDGALYWMIDAFTATDRYPYSRQIRFGDVRANYIRNSVKVVINAYDGTTRFYVYDPEDPLIEAWRATFPDLFRDADEMPETLRPHVRYPELLFRIQAAVYAVYHVEDIQVFYNQEDVWSVAQQGRSQAGSDEIEPYFVLMQFPDEDQVEFVSILPFTPSNRNNLIGWMAARSDGDFYGRVRAYTFPKTRFVDGPLQIEARIDQDPDLSSQLSLWNQQGSTVLRGNLLVIPLGDTLLFVTPIYLRAERSPMPELRIVVLATEDRMAYGSTFSEALAKLLGRSVRLDLTSTSAVTGSQPGPAAGAGVGTRTDELIGQARDAFEAYQRLTAEGRLGEAGGQLDRLRDALNALGESGP